MAAAALSNQTHQQDRKHILQGRRGRVIGNLLLTVVEH